ncbi:MAG: phosphatidate cytidylyltransferase [Bacteroidota bacterium]
MSSLKSRVVTAVFFVLAMLIGVITNAYTYIILFGIINILCLWEFLTLLLPKKGWKSVLRLVIGISLGTLPFVMVGLLYTNFLGVQVIKFFDIVIFVLPLIFLLFLFELYSGDDHPFKLTSYIVLAVFYIGLPFSLLIPLAYPYQVFKFDICLGLILYVWTNDTAAYFIGSRLGRTPLLPRISPKKTWEGTLGAAAIVLLISIPMSYLFPILSFTNWMVIAFIVPIAGTLGDLVESMFKRSIQIKDTGSILPGHGGFMDRFDGFIFTIPFVTVYLYIVGVLHIFF